MVASYTIDDLRAAVRALIQNIPPSIYPDTVMDIALAVGKARLDIDRPNNTTATIIGTDGSYYQLTDTVGGWVNDQSEILSVIYPVPDQAAGELPSYIDYKSYQLTRLGANDFIFANDRFVNGKSAMVQYTTPWSVAGLGGSLTTSITTQYQTALALICASRVCTSLAAKAAGTLDDQVPADEINYRSMEQEYGRAAQNFLDLYNDVLGIDTAGAKAILVRADYDDRNASRFITHRTVLGTR